MRGSSWKPRGWRKGRGWTSRCSWNSATAPESRTIRGISTGGSPEPLLFTLLDYFPDDWLLFIDESHISVPQVRGMYRGDRSRKETLVRYGFRLPSALDNRPLSFEEFRTRLRRTVYVSATPGPYELSRTEGHVVEQIIRPTGLVDPRIEVRPADFQVDDLVGEIRKKTARGHRVLVTTLTKRMAEDLTEYLAELNIRVRYMHSDIGAIERIEIIRDLRLGEYDVLVGINLLREGLDIPEVSLVAVLDADNEGFLRSDRSLIQTAGRAARNVDGIVILYANHVTDSMRRAIEETERRRLIQVDHNETHGIVPQTIRKEITDILAEYRERPVARRDRFRDGNPAGLQRRAGGGFPGRANPPPRKGHERIRRAPRIREGGRIPGPDQEAPAAAAFHPRLSSLSAFSRAGGRRSLRIAGKSAPNPAGAPGCRRFRRRRRRSRFPSGSRCPNRVPGTSLSEIPP